MQDGTEIHSLNYLEIAGQILEHLPEAELVDQETLEVISCYRIFITLIFLTTIL